jgi:tetratricopeptide (TPR) repeat protein
MEFHIIAAAIILLGISIGYIFITLIFMAYLIKRFLKIRWLVIFPFFIAGFSLVLQESTFKTIIPIKKENRVLKGTQLLGWTYFLNGNYKKSMLAYLKANAISYNKETQKRIGQCYLNLGKLERGIFELEKIKNPDYETILTLGQAYTQNGKIKDAINIYKKTIKEGISPEEFYVKIAQIASQNGMENELNRAIDKASLYGSPKHKLYHIKAEFYFRENDLEKAHLMYDKSLNYNPRSVASLTGKGMAYFKQGRIKEATKQLSKALEIESRNDAIYNNLGAIQMTEGNYTRAEITFLKSLKINPNQEEAHYNLGLIYETKGNIPQALQMYQKALIVNPDYLPAKLKIKVLQK